MQLTEGQKRYVLNRLKTEAVKCRQCGTEEWVFSNKGEVMKIWGADRYMVPLSCVNGCLGGLLYSIEGLIPEDPGVIT